MNYLLSEEQLKKLDSNFEENKYEKCFMGIVEADLDLFLTNYSVINIKNKINRHLTILSLHKYV